ncbi:hypothetical protein GCM10010981_19220 [Dyella nitratireducens]|uniref:Uncharacterized protein n=2 Tax=Dyella nitratireducens TaxID=1849580 RepID=A0ABQ1FUH5_9GAMM|nr:hypothetical protein GCM10010981_19220 [Dyella nitratireducens]GLQ43015.1 hypothetical protein GCM10007902_28650 [Dyella nitratireducens]
MDLSVASQAHRVYEWLTDEFGWVVECEGVSKETRYLHADRYGATDGVAQHGGSGRVATLGCFQAKGIGQTPLVSHGIAEGHSHGCLSVAEALREAIFAEIASAEFPHGAIPAMAVIDTGLFFSSANPDDRYDQNARRAILVRPATVRPAHAERAPMFKRSVTGFVNRQVDDVQRTRDMITQWVNHISDVGTQMERNTLRTFVQMVVEQIAFGQIHRLFSGGYFSSNVSISGELLDFGNAHALPNWASAQVHSVLPGLGDEINLLKRVIASLIFYFTKYRKCDNALPLTQELQASADAFYEGAWRHYGLELLQANHVGASEKDAMHRILRGYFQRQQKSRVKYRFGEVIAGSGAQNSNWLYLTLVSDSAKQDTDEYQTLCSIDGILKGYDKSVRYVAWWTAARLLKPRESLDRKYLHRALERLIPKLIDRRTPDARTVDQFLQESISAARRYWRRLPVGYAVHAHTTLDGCSALVCSDGSGSKERFIWLEGIIGPDDSLCLFDRQLSRSDFDHVSICCSGTRWSATCPLNMDADGVYIANLTTRGLVLPNMGTHYECPTFFLRRGRYG